MLRNINTTGIISYNCSTMRTIHRYIGLPTLRRTSSWYHGSPQDLQLLFTSNTAPTDAHGKISTRALQQQLGERIQVLNTETNAHLRETQQRYKSDYDCRILVTLTCRPGDLVFHDRPSILKTSFGIAYSIASAAYNKLLPWSPGPFRIIAINLHSFAINEKSLTRLSLFASRPTPRSSRLQIPTNWQTRAAESLTKTRVKTTKSLI